MSAGVYQAAAPALQKWLSRHDNVADLLARFDVQTANFATRSEATFESTRRTMQAKQDIEAESARVHHDARDSRIPVDEHTHKRLVRAQQNAAQVHERATVAAADASRDASETRGAANGAVALANKMASTDAKVKFAEPVKLPKGHPADIVKAQRVLIKLLAADEKTANAAPIPEEEAVEVALAELDQYYQEGSRAIWPMEPSNATPIPGLLMGDVVNVKALVANLLHDEMAARIKRLMHAYYLTLPAPLDVIQRRTALKDIATRRLAAERIEVAAVLAAWDEGVDVPLRADTNPMAMLGIESFTEGESAEPRGFIGKMGDVLLGQD